MHTPRFYIPLSGDIVPGRILRPAGYDRRISLLLLLLLPWMISGTVMAQEDTTRQRIMVSGQVKAADSEEHKPLGFSTLQNISSGKGAVTNSIGFFNIRIGPHDTLLVKHMGYVSQILLPHDSVYTRSFFTISLPRAYNMIDEVDVEALSWHKFKHEIINKPVPEPERYGTDTALTALDKAAVDFMNSPDGVGFSIPLGLKSSAQKQYAKLEEIKARDKIERTIRSKFNHRLVSRITGLQGDVLTEFVLWLDFSGVFLLHANEYTIIKRIRSQYRIYRQLKEAAGHSLPPLDTLQNASSE